MLKDRLHIVRILAARGARMARGALGLPVRTFGKLRNKTPDRLLISPQDIRTSDPTIAADITAGYFAFGGKIVNAHGRSPFALEPGSEMWARQLAGFGWLRHLRAGGSPVAGQRGRTLVDDFLSAYGRPSAALAWEPRVAARRMLAWMSQSAVILGGADRGFYGRFMQALATHRAVLDRHLTGGLTGDDRLLVALALAEFGLCTQGAGSYQRRGTGSLASEINAQVLPDGGHISRNPQTLIDLLLDLLPLRQAYAARGLQAPQQVLNSIDRMMPMLRLFRHGDGTMALFNGMGVTAPELVATILAYDDARAQPVANARYAGYQRLEQGSSVVIVDSGPAPPGPFSTQAHAGCLSFELSSGFRRIVINCGAPEMSRSTAREAARTTAAHSTLVVADTSSCRFAASAGLRRWLGDQILAGPTNVPVERSQVGPAAVVTMSHDGYVAQFGLKHNRRLSLSADGTLLEGLDGLEDSGKRNAAVDYALRFHLHPGMKARNAADGDSVRLDAADGEIWVFEADAPVLIEPSVLFAASGGARPTIQIKIASNTGLRQEIRWAFRRIAAGPARR